MGNRQGTKKPLQKEAAGQEAGAPEKRFAPTPKMASGSEAVSSASGDNFRSRRFHVAVFKNSGRDAINIVSRRVQIIAGA